MRSASRSVVVRVSLSCYTQILKKFFRRSWRKRIPSTGYLNHLIGAVDRIEHSYIVEDEGTVMSTLSDQRAYLDERYGEPPRRQLMLSRVTLVIVSLLILTNLVAALFVAGYQIYYDGLIYPGVSVWGADLSGMTPSEAASALNGQFHYPQTVTITFRDGQNIWPMTAGDLGVQFDIERTVQAAYEVGRDTKLFASLGQQFTARRQGIVVSPVVVCLIAIPFGVRDDELGVLFLLAAAPTAAASFIMARAMGGNSGMAANIVLLSTACSIVTVTGGLSFLKFSGLI